MLSLHNTPDSIKVCDIVKNGRRVGDVQWHPTINEKYKNSFDNIHDVNDEHFRDRFELSKEQATSILSGIHTDTVVDSKKYFQVKRHIKESLLIEMDLTGKPVGNGDLAVIARHPHLQTLWLTKPGVTDAGLADLQPLRHLRVLGLARTGITDAGLKHLAAIKSLREIWIYPTRVSEGAVNNLKTALPGVRVIY